MNREINIANTKCKKSRHADVDERICACVIRFDRILIDLQIILEEGNYFAQNTNYTSLSMCKTLSCLT